MKLIKDIHKNTAEFQQEYLDSRYEKLLFKGHPGLDFYVFTFLSASIAALGFIMNSPSVIIGAMVLSPLLYPIVLSGSALSRSHWNRSVKLMQMLGIGAVLAFLVAVFFAYTLPVEYSTEIQDRLSSSSLQYFLVAFFSGLAGTFAYYWPDVSESITGVGISVALMPPIVMTGIALGNSDTDLFYKSGMIVFVNITGIIVASFLMSHFLWWYSRRGSKK